MKGDPALLAHILESISKIERYTSSGHDAFQSDSMTQDAVIRNLEVIGEAVKGLSTELKERHPDIPWKQISGMRDFLIHVYFGVDLGTVWLTATSDLAPLKTAVESEITSP